MTVTNEFEPYLARNVFGTTAAQIRAFADTTTPANTSLSEILDELDISRSQVRSTIGGAPSDPTQSNVWLLTDKTKKTHRRGITFAAAMEYLATKVESHDSDINALATSHPDADAEEAGELARPINNRLDGEGDDVAALLDGDPDADLTVKDLILAGYIPLGAADYWPAINANLTDEERTTAEVNGMIRELREQGLLDDPVTNRYREWLENAVENDVDIDTIIDIVRDHDIDPVDFEVLDGLERIEDNDGKSYFMLPEGISPEDAQKAVLMTYIYNTGTGYGTAENSDENDFEPTPYSSDEVQRIIDRQEANSWSYQDDIGFVHRNGGEMVTTPNGMVMGLGGNWLQDLYSQGGGTAWGDIFMINIDDVDDEKQQLRDIIDSGHAWYADDDGQPFEGSLDLDRLLHHEERHSQQWAEYGYAEFLARYAGDAGSTGIVNTTTDVGEAVLGWFGQDVEVEFFPQLEVDAGLSDGGYR